MATKSAKKTKTKKIKPAVKTVKKKVPKKVTKKNIEKTAQKKTARKIAVKKSVSKKPVTNSPLAKKNPLKVAKNTTRKTNNKSVLKPATGPAKATKTIKTKPTKVTPPIPKTKTVMANKTNLFPKPAANYYHEHLKFWFILFFAILVVLLFSQLSGGLISKTYADLKSEIVQNPVIYTAGEFYKYEVPADQWEYFKGETVLKNLYDSGIYYDEAWYQEGGKVCNGCNGSAAPLVYIKNPSRPLSQPWVEVSQPGFYGNGQYTIHHYY